MILGENISKVYNKGKEIQKVYSYGKLVWENKNSEDIDYSTIPFTITAVADDVSVRLRGNEGVNVNYKYSINGGSWVETDTSTTINIKKNDEVSFISINTKIDGTSQYIRYCDIVGLSDVCGNIMSLGYGDDFIGKTIWWSNYQDEVDGFFSYCDISNAKKLILPATELSGWGYANMFSGCKSLTQAPALPATRLASNCYYMMFSGCTNLTTAPELPATTLAYDCYGFMFSGCTRLTTAPALPATTLADWCYSYMFQYCTRLTQAPALPATTLADWCYYHMFDGCKSLTQAPELPATTLVYMCYGFMFYGCTSLTQAPELPATTLAYDCYYSMFKNCSKLNYIKCYAQYNINLNISGFANGAAPTGKLVCYKEVADDFRQNIPSGWIVEYI